MNYELIKKMQKNWTAFGGLTKEEEQCLKDNWDHALIRSRCDWNKPINVYSGDLLGSVLRINPKWKPWEDAPEGYRLVTEEERKKVGRWVEYDVKPKNRSYYVLFNSSKCGLKPCKHFDRVKICNVNGIIGFGGVKFDGQSDNLWHMDISVSIGSDGHVSCDMLFDDDLPAVPVKVRFWVEA